VWCYASSPTSFINEKQQIIVIISIKLATIAAYNKVEMPYVSQGWPSAYKKVDNKSEYYNNNDIRWKVQRPA